MFPKTVLCSLEQKTHLARSVQLFSVFSMFSKILFLENKLKVFLLFLTLFREQKKGADALCVFKIGVLHVLTSLLCTVSVSINMSPYKLHLVDGRTYTLSVSTNTSPTERPWHTFLCIFFIFNILKFRWLDLVKWG